MYNIRKRILFSMIINTLPSIGRIINYNYVHLSNDIIDNDKMAL